jgi:DNA repair exonuclease SbcCD ATPase subunit
MPSAVFKEEEEKEKKRREEEKKKKEEQSKDELTHKAETKKDAVQKGEMKEMSFGEAKPIVEVGYMKVHIKGTLASEKYEPVVKESLAVKLVEEEKKKELEKEKERISSEIEKTEEAIKKNEEVIKQKNKEIQKLEKEKIEKEKIKQEEKLKKEKEEKQRIQEKIKKEKEQIAKLLEEARKKGMIEPIQDIAKQLIVRELKRGTPPKTALRRVMAILTRLDLVKTKKDKKSILKFLKSLFKK